MIAYYDYGVLVLLMLLLALLSGGGALFIYDKYAQRRMYGAKEPNACY